MSKLYLTKVSRFVEADPIRGRASSAVEYRGPFILESSSPEEAKQSTITYCNSTRTSGWEVKEIRELKMLEGVLTLEVRKSILSEVGLEVIN
jgi:hypothetical protein